MDEDPVWQQYIKRAYKGLDYGTVMQSLIDKWGSGKVGKELVAAVASGVEKIISGLEAFGFVSDESFRGALDAALKSPSTGKKAQQEKPNYYTKSSAQPYGAMGCAPSGLGHSNYFNLQTSGENAPFFRDNRPYHNWDVPISLLSPHFAKFIVKMKTSQATREDEQAALKLCQLMTAIYRKGEQQKMNVVNSHLAKYIGLKLTRLTLSNSVVNDGAITKQQSEETTSPKAQACSIEHKWEADHGGADPRIQNTGYHYLHGLACADQVLLPGSPTFSMQTVGEFVSFGGVYSADKEVYQPLTPSYPAKQLLSLDRSKHGINYQLAVALRTFKSCVIELHNEYAKAVPASDSHQNLPYPLITGGRFQEIKRAIPLNPFIYACKTMDDDMQLVKYTQLCNPQVHQELSDLGYTPKLRHARRIADNDYFEVVSALCEGEAGWRSPSQLDDTEKAKEMCMELMQKIHNAGFVVGDPKPDNFLLRLDEDSGEIVDAKLCDLEWVGRQGEAVYPLWMNHNDLVWPNGAESGVIISADFDRQFLQTSWEWMQNLKILSPERRKRKVAADSEQYVYVAKRLQI